MRLQRKLNMQTFRKCSNTQRQLQAINSSVCVCVCAVFFVTQTSLPSLEEILFVYIIIIIVIILFSLIHLFRKIKVGFYNHHAVCVSVYLCIPSLTFEWLN
jgi:hypothetical protein